MNDLLMPEISIYRKNSSAVLISMHAINEGIFMQNFVLI